MDPKEQLYMLKISAVYGEERLSACRCLDEGKMKDLSLAVEKLTQQVARQKDALEAEITDTQAAQIQLDRAAQDFRQLHQERQDLIRLWDEAREAMKHRDEAIQVGGAEQANTDMQSKPHLQTPWLCGRCSFNNPGCAGDAASTTLQQQY